MYGWAGSSGRKPKLLLRHGKPYTDAPYAQEKMKVHFVELSREEDASSS